MDNEYIIALPKTESEPFNILLAGITYENPDYIISRKNIPYSVVEYVISGCGHIEINGNVYTVFGGDMYILPPNSRHTYYSDDKNPWCKIWFNASGILINSLLRIYGIENKIVFKNANGYSYMKKIINICENKKYSGEEINTKVSSVLFDLICFLSAHEHSCESKISKEAEILKNHIDMNVEKNIHISELAKKIYRSESQTIRIFKNAYNQTPYDYLIEQKIYSANLFLLNTGMSIKEIALRLGFCDEHYFSNIYKKKTGKTPSDFRKAYLKIPNYADKATH